MSDVSIEMLTTVVLDMDRRFGQRLQKMESLMLEMGKQVTKLERQVEQIGPRIDQLSRKFDENLRQRGEVDTAAEQAQQAEALKKIDGIFRLHEEMALTTGHMLSAVMGVKDKIRDLSEVEFDVTSPGGEDGIIDWLIAHVPVAARRFVEIGGGTFRHGLCRFLAARRGWKGLLLDPDDVALYHARQDDFYRACNLVSMEALVTREKIDELIVAGEFAGPLGLLALEAGGNEYWTWSGLTVAKPDIVVSAFNPVFGDKYAVTIPYNPHFAPLEAHPSGYYRGASIAALKLLAEEKGYAFLGTNAKGTSAFFVAAELASHILPLIAAPCAFPARARNQGDTHEELESVGGISRLRFIQELPVVDLTSGRTVKLAELDQPYSEEWQRGMS